VDPPAQAARRWRSFPAEAARWFDRLKLGEIQIADRPQRLGERAFPQVFRQAVQSGGVFSLGFHEAGDKIDPTSGPAAMIERAT